MLSPFRVTRECMVHLFFTAQDLINFITMNKIKIMSKKYKLASVFAGLLLICSSWEDHPDKEYRDANFDRCEREWGCDYTEGWNPEKDNCRDRSDSVTESRGTCTGIPDRDK
jgi:hypothetical protein